MTTTREYPLAAARAFSNLCKPFKVIYVSDEGTTSTPGKLAPYFGVIKGEAEVALRQLHKDNPDSLPISVRPGGVDPSVHPEIYPFVLKLLMSRLVLCGAAFPVLRVVWKNGLSPTTNLRRFLVGLAMSNGDRLEGDGIEDDGRTVRNSAFRRLSGL